MKSILESLCSTESVRSNSEMKFNFGRRLNALFSGQKRHEDLIDEIEELLISADFGVEFTMEISSELRKRLSSSGNQDPRFLLTDLIREKMSQAQIHGPSAGLSAHLIFGVNGSGKTTTAAKLAYRFKQQGRRVLIAAADTYRDAAIEQLLEWSRRADVPVIKQFQGSDPGAVVYDACEAAQHREVHDLIIDTAGRLHTKERLMDELAKIGRVLDRKLPEAARKKLLVIDATTGQNALSQALQFNEYIGVDEIIITKLDSSAKGGIACAVSGMLNIPISYAGTGEKMEDLIEFNIDEYLRMLFSPI